MKKILAAVMAIAIAFGMTQVVSAAGGEKAQALMGVTVSNESGYSVTISRNYDLALELYHSVNNERAKVGLPALVLDQELMDAAMLRAAEITILFDHYRPNGQQCYSVSDAMNGENIAYGYRSVAVVMTGWMDSEGHRKNILNDQFQSIGVAVATHNGKIYWVQSYGQDTAKNPVTTMPANGDRTYTISVDRAFCESRGVNLSGFAYQKRGIDDEGRTYPKGTMFRMYNSNTGEHFYTDSLSERNGLFAAGWNYEGIAWTAPETSSTPVYRLYDPKTGDHHYTTSASEKNDLANKYGWIYEKIGWYSDDAGGVPLYRLYNPRLSVGAHHYTMDINEKNSLLASGWIDEGVGWYGKK